ncbi:MAG: hypothetical protein ACXWC0_31320 [Burkholderiales bacterium]
MKMRIFAIIAALLTVNWHSAFADQGTSYIYPFYPSTTSAFQGFVRFINPSNTTETVTVNFLDYATATKKSSCSLTIAGFSAPQYSASQLEQCALLTPDSSTNYELQFTFGQPAINLYYQYVLWSPTTGYFTSAATCFTPGQPLDFAANVHTSSLPGYPATVVLETHAPLNYRVKALIYDQQTGAQIGTWQGDLQNAAQEVVAIPESTIEAQGSWTVSTKPYHINLKVSLVSLDGTQTYPDAVHVAANLVTQTARGEVYNMGAMCRQ